MKDFICGVRDFLADERTVSAVKNAFRIFRTVVITVLSTGLILDQTDPERFHRLTETLLGVAI